MPTPPNSQTARIYREADANERPAERQWEDMWENDDYENEYYYVSQLFELNWQPRIMA